MHRQIKIKIYIFIYKTQNMIHQFAKICYNIVINVNIEKYLKFVNNQNFNILF